MKKFVTNNLWIIVIIVAVAVGAIYYRNWQAKKSTNA